MPSEAPSSNFSPPPENMKSSPARVIQLVSALSSIKSRISSTTASHSIHKPVRLIAVSKLKPITDIIALASPSPSEPQPTTHTPHTHFGENYVQELLEKSRLLPSELRGKIHWHFIGGLQSNKAQALAREVRGLWAVESVDSVKKANLLDKGRGERRAIAKQESDGKADDYDADDDCPLRIFVQVNTSGEDSKSGLEPRSPDLLHLCTHIRDNCHNLHLQGLMTIGAIARSKASNNATSSSAKGTDAENEDFRCLRETRDWVVKEMGDGTEGLALELSMGMSEDFEMAIRMGSDEVRVGSTLFGERAPKAEASVLPQQTQEEEKKNNNDK